VGVAIELSGKRKSPAPPSDLLTQAEKWLREATGDLLERATRLDVDGAPWLLVRLHPVAEELRIGVLANDTIVVQAKTSPVGPGYHVYVCQLLRRLGVALRIDWDKDQGDDSGYWTSGNREDAEHAMTEWIADVARRVLFLPPGSGAVALSMPSDVVFHAQAHVLTPLGPRDTEWLRKVAADEATARDFFPWWPDERGPEVLLQRALCLMWTEVRWRAPLTDEERELLAQISRLLDTAHRLDISLAYPWREWAQLLDHLGEAKGPLHEMVVRRASRVASDRPLIGYRRGQVSLQLPAGWRLTVPGSFASQVNERGGVVAGEAARKVSLEPVPLASGDQRDAATLLASVSLPPLSGAAPAIEHVAGNLVARGVLLTLPSGRLELTGAVAVPGALATLKVAGDAADRPWVEAALASVSHPNAG
jgi:hypothetical protein